MSDPKYALVRACFENMEEVFPAGDPRERKAHSRTNRGHGLPQLPQMPQAGSPAIKPPSLEEDRFEERAAIIEYDGGLPRALAEFLASSGA